MTKYTYKIKSCENQETPYKKIFEAFGHTGSLMNMEIFNSLSEEEKQSIGNVYFMLNEDRTAQIYAPFLTEEISGKSERTSTMVMALKTTLKTCKKYDFVPTSYISTNENSTLGEVFGFNGETTKETIGGVDFFETSFAQSKVSTKTTPAQNPVQ